MNCAKTKTVLLLTRSSNASYIGMRLGNLRGFDSLYRIRAGTLLMKRKNLLLFLIHFLKTIVPPR
nr:MAG TPA: hypothetical protein [Caudoviricetes sp.]